MPVRTPSARSFSLARSFATLAALGGLALAPNAHASDILLSDYVSGEDIEGVSLGDVGLRIYSTAAGGDVTAVAANATPQAYGAPNYGSVRTGPDGTWHGQSGFPSNGCMNGVGFTDAGISGSNGQPGFDFTFDEPVYSFGVRMLDFGDYNPTRSRSQQVLMSAYDADGNLVAEQLLSYTSDGGTNPRSATINGTTVDPMYASDACWAGEYAEVTGGNPITGIYNWNVTDTSGAGIVEVTLEFLSGWDPKIAFDTLSVVAHQPPTEVDFCAGQDTVVGSVSASRDGDLVCVDYTMTDGWSIGEVHTEVVTSVDAFPLSRSGNPKIGHFSMSEGFDTTTESAGSYCFDLNDIGWTGGPVYIGAHAAVENGTSEETAWGGCEEGSRFGGNSWATYFTYEP